MTTSPAIQTLGGFESGVIEIQGRAFARELQGLSGTTLNRCFHCQSCAAGCPFIQAMDYPPNRIIRLVQFGLRRQALESRAIWVCVGCSSCAAECPNGVDLPAVMEALRHLALKEGVKVAAPEILDFHREVFSSVRRYGRTHELGIILRYKVRVGKWFTDLNLGLKMLTRRKLDLRASKVKATKEISRLFLPQGQR
ncbi:MAG: 4Fe-4S dicluster domain-containing protein [Desulfobaccales bacterium]